MQLNTLTWINIWVNYRNIIMDCISQVSYTLLMIENKSMADFKTYQLGDINGFSFYLCFLFGVKVYFKLIVEMQLSIKIWFQPQTFCGPI